MNGLSKYFGNEGFAAPEDNGFDGEYTLLPTGWYPTEISKVEIKDNNAGTGARFIVTFTIIGEKFANRKVWNGNGFNFINASQQAQAIGQQELGKLTRACGYGENERLHDEDELLGKQLDIYVVTEAGTGEYKDKNVATKFRALGSGGKDVPAPIAPKAAIAPASPSASAPAPDTAGKFPWER